MRTARAVPMPCWCRNTIADPLLVRPGRGDPVGPLRTDPRDFAQTRRTGLDDVEDVRAEQADQTRGIDRADAPDQAGAEIFFDAFHRRGGGGFQEPHAELPPVRPVVGPFAGGGDPFARRNHRGMAHRSDEIAVATGLETEHAEAGLGVVEGDPLDEAGQDLAARCGASSAGLASGGAVAVVSGRVRAGMPGGGLGEFNWSSQHLDDEVLRWRNGNGDGQTGRVDLRCVRLAGRR